MCVLDTALVPVSHLIPKKGYSEDRTSRKRLGTIRDTYYQWMVSKMYNNVFKLISPSGPLIHQIRNEPSMESL